MTHFRTCPLCEAMCGLEIETEGDRVISIRGDADDPLSAGYLCPKGPALIALQDDPDRLREPLVKRDGEFVVATWDEALDRAAEGIHRVQKAHGRDAVAIYLGNPTVHNTGASLFSPMLVRALRTKNRYSATSVDQLPHHLAAHLMFGHQFLLPIPDLDRTRHLLVLGANPLASNGSLMSAPGVRRRLRAIQKRGGRVVVVDPRRTETAQLADAHHFIRPGSDAWLLAAMVRGALERGRGLGRLTGHVDGITRLRAAVAPFTSERAAGPTGISEAAIEEMIDQLCAAPSAAVYGRIGTSTQRFGGLATWLITALNFVTGNFDREGGVLFTTPAVDGVSMPGGFGIGRGSFGRWRSRVRGLPETGGELPVATLADEMLTPGEGQVRALVTSAGNPALSTPNGARLERALEGLEHQVAIDFYVNETTRHADVILPPPSPLERPHYDVAFHHLAVRNTAKFSRALFAPGAGTRADESIVLDLIERLDTLRGTRTAASRARSLALRQLGVEGLLALALKVGPHGAKAWPPRAGLSLAELQASPHGVDLGPLQPSLPQRTKRWKDPIDLAPAPYLEDLSRLAASESDVAPMVLIGRRHLRSNNSWMHNAPKLMAGKPICTLLMHPHDAASRGIEEGATVKVSSRVGQIEVPVELSDEVMPGVVSLPHGFGHDRPGVRLRVAKEHAGASINDLTDEQLIDTLSGNAALSGVPVEVSAL